MSSLVSALLGLDAPQSQPPLASMIMSNPVGTERIGDQSLTNPTPDVQPAAFWGGQPVSQNLANAVQNGTNLALGWVGTFGGPAAQTADLAKLAAAKDMLTQGASKEAILGGTGWFQGPEGNWRFEIPDNQMQRLATVSGDGAPLGAVIDHPDLFAAYPQLRQTNVQSSSARSGGSFSPGMAGDPALITLGSNQSPYTLLHEIQHNVQNIEGNTRGGSMMSVATAPDLAPHFLQKYREIAKNVTTPISYEDYAQQAWGGEMSPESLAGYNQYVKNVPKSIPLYSQQDKAIQETASRNVYDRIAGEAEARETANRYPLTAAERAAKPPLASLGGVPWDQLIVRPPSASGPIDIRSLLGGGAR